MFPYVAPICTLCGTEITAVQQFELHTNGVEYMYVHHNPSQCDVKGLRDIAELRRMWDYKPTAWTKFLEEQGK